MYIYHVSADKENDPGLATFGHILTRPEKTSFDSSTYTGEHGTTRRLREGKRASYSANRLETYEVSMGGGAVVRRCGNVTMASNVANTVLPIF